MFTKRRLLGTFALILPATLFIACGSDSPAAPSLEEVDPATVYFVSLFNDENGGGGAYNWTDFAEWDVVAGCVDLHGNDFIDIWPNNGLYVDLDGTCTTGGMLLSKEEVTLPPGDYVLEFWLAGNNRIDPPDTVNVAFGSMHQEQIVMQRTDPFRHFERPFSISEQTSAPLSFHNLGGDDYGLLLDLVRVREQGADEVF